jgi:hypothetical protein
MPRSPTEEGVQRTEHSQVFGNHQQNQPRHNPERYPSMPQAVKENDVTRGEQNCSHDQQPRAHQETAMSSHGFDPLFAMLAITHSMEHPREQTANR